MDYFYYFDGGKVAGPHNLYEIQEMFAMKRITTQTPVVRAGENDWRTLGAYCDLIEFERGIKRNDDEYGAEAQRHQKLAEAAEAYSKGDEAFAGWRKAQNSLITEDVELTTVIEGTEFERNSSSSIKATLAALGGCLGYIIGLIGIVVLLGMVFTSTPWVAQNVFPWATIVIGVIVFLGVPVSLLLAIFRKTRGIGGLGLYLTSYAIGLHLWLSSLIVAYTLAGVSWMIIGLLFGGIGVVPVAFIASIIRTEWSVMWQILLVIGVIATLRFFGVFLIGKADQG